MNLIYIHHGNSPELLYMSGYGSGNGDGHGFGEGKGCGFGCGDGYGDGDGYGNGDGIGSGFGYGDGYGDTSEWDDDQLSSMEMAGQFSTGFGALCNGYYICIGKRGRNI